MNSSLRGLLIALIVLILLTLSGPFMMDGMMRPEGMGASGGWQGGMMWGFGGVTLLAFLGVVVVCVVLLVRVLDKEHTTRPSDRSHRETPLEILQRRYAAGDVTREQFEQTRKDLGHES